MFVHLLSRPVPHPSSPAKHHISSRHTRAETWTLDLAISLCSIWSNRRASALCSDRTDRFEVFILLCLPRGTSTDSTELQPHHCTTLVNTIQSFLRFHLLGLDSIHCQNGGDAQKDHGGAARGYPRGTPTAGTVLFLPESFRCILLFVFLKSSHLFFAPS